MINFGVSFNDDTPDSEIAAWLAARLLDAGRSELGYCLARIAKQAARVEADNYTWWPAARGEAAVPPPLATLSAVDPGEGPTGNGDEDLDAAAALEQHERARAALHAPHCDGTCKRHPGAACPEPPPTHRCGGRRKVDGVTAECWSPIYLSELPGRVDMIGVGKDLIASTWLHVDPGLDLDHPAIGPSRS